MCIPQTNVGKLIHFKPKDSHLWSIHISHSTCAYWFYDRNSDMSAISFFFCHSTNQQDVPSLPSPPTTSSSARSNSFLATLSVPPRVQGQEVSGWKDARSCTLHCSKSELPTGSSGLFTSWISGCQTPKGWGSHRKPVKAESGPSTGGLY